MNDSNEIGMFDRAAYGTSAPQTPQPAPRETLPQNVLQRITTINETLDSTRADIDVGCFREDSLLRLVDDVAWLILVVQQLSKGPYMPVSASPLPTTTPATPNPKDK